MRLDDITVEVRDKDLKRIGQVRPEELSIEITDQHNNVGAWKLSLAVEHRLTPYLREPGGGIIVTGPGDAELFSGPMVTSKFTASSSDPGGSIEFEGVDDTVILADPLVYPQPSNPDPTTQTLAHDVRTGAVESVMHAFVAANVGPNAPAGRRHPKLIMGADGGRGGAVTKSARFPVLGNLLSDLAGSARLGFRVIQRGSNLVFETYEVVDRSKTVRLDVWNNTLAKHEVALSAPGATRAIVAGQGELVNRQFLQVTSADSLAAETLWGRRIERWVDQRNTNVIAELTKAGQEVLDKEGFTAVAAKATPMDDTSIEFGSAWNLGDQISIVVEGQEVSSIVTSYVLKANSSGFFLGAVIGDLAGFDANVALSKRVTDLGNRTSALERNAEAGDYAHMTDVQELSSILSRQIEDNAIMNIMGVW